MRRKSNSHLDVITSYLDEVITAVPTTTEKRSRTPDQRSREIGGRAAAKAALIAGGLSLPTGPWGLLTVIPDLVSVWKIQAQMIVDIAGVYGKRAVLGREQMLYCLFKHAASQAVRDLVIRIGERFIITEVSLFGAQKVLQQIGITLSHRITGRVISRWLPAIGALGVGAYAFYDTAQVAKTTMELMSGSIASRVGASTILARD